MGKSYRKNDYSGWTKKESEKREKRLANRAFRKHNKQVESEEDYYYDLKEISDNWTFSKDGKHYFGNLDKEWKKKLRRK